MKQKTQPNKKFNLVSGIIEICAGAAAWAMTQFIEQNHIPAITVGSCCIFDGARRVWESKDIFTPFFNSPVWDLAEGSEYFKILGDTTSPDSHE